MFYKEYSHLEELDFLNKCEIMVVRFRVICQGCGDILVSGLLELETEMYKFHQPGLRDINGRDLLYNPLYLLRSWYISTCHNDRFLCTCFI